MQNAQRKTVFTIITFVVIVVIAGGVGMGVRWWQTSRDKQRAAEDVSGTLNADITDVQNLAAQGKNDQANKKVDDALKQPGLTSDEKYQLLIQKGNIVYNQKDYKAALDYYTRAAAVKKTQNIYELLGQTAVLMNNTQAATTYYKQAITYLNRNSPVWEDNKASLEQKIRDLGGQP